MQLCDVTYSLTTAHPAFYKYYDWGFWDYRVGQMVKGWQFVSGQTGALAWIATGNEITVSKQLSSSALRFCELYVLCAFLFSDLQY